MLELDSDLFQTAVLGLLVLSLLILLLVLSTLSKIRKTLEDALSRSGIGDITSPQAEEASPTSTFDAPAAASAGVAGASSVAGAAPGTATPAAGQSVGETSWGAPAPDQGTAGTSWDAPATGGGASESSGWAAPAETAAVPVQEQTHEPQVAATPGRPGPNLADMPEEQPVEHEGRWWFKRAGELLVYDESTGQWGPAPQGAGGAGPAVDTGGGSAYSAFKDLGDATSDPAPTAAGTSSSEAAAFWKCPSCGAVNGTTAESCRMCFATRPV